MDEKSIQELKQKVHDMAIQFGPMSPYSISCVNLLWLIREATPAPADGEHVHNWESDPDGFEMCFECGRVRSWR